MSDQICFQMRLKLNSYLYHEQHSVKKKKHLLCNIDFVLLISHRFDNEVSIRQSVEADIAGLKKVTDDTNLSRMNIESEIEAVREELAYLKKNHESVSSQHLQFITLY